MNLKDINLDWWIEDTLHRVPLRQREESDKAIEGLPYFVNALTGSNKDDRGNVIPFGTGPHSFKAFEIWSKILSCNCSDRCHLDDILEIGFNLGHGAAALLHLFPKTDLTSVDIRDSSEVHNAHKILNEKYSGRHRLVIGDSATVKLPEDTYDAAFVDGAHDLQSIMKDIATCRRYGVRHFLMDDVHPRHGDTLEAIKRSGLKLHAIVGANMAICEDIG